MSHPNAQPTSGQDKNIIRYSVIASALLCALAVAVVDVAATTHHEVNLTPAAAAIELLATEVLPVVRRELSTPTTEGVRS